MGNDFRWITVSSSNSTMDSSANWWTPSYGSGYVSTVGDIELRTTVVPPPPPDDPLVWLKVRVQEMVELSGIAA